MENEKNKNYETVKVLVPTEITVPFLQTRNSRKERFMKETVEVVVDVKVPDAADFPVAFEVTDYANIADGVTKKDFDNLSNDELHHISNEARMKLNTEEVRLFDGKLYKPVHVNLSGALQSSLYEDSPDYIQEKLKYYHNDYGHFDEKEAFDKDKSVIQEDGRLKNWAEKTSMIQKDAEKYLMFGGKVWHECGEPFFKLQTFGLSMEPHLFIEYCSDQDYFDTNLSKSTNCFSALHARECRERLQKLSLGSDFPKESIKVLIPDACRIKDHIDTRREEEREKNARFDTIVEKNATPDVGLVDSPAAIAGRFERALKGYLLDSISKNPYDIARVILSTWQQEKKDMLNEYFKGKGVCSKESFDKYFAETFGVRKVGLRYEIGKAGTEARREVKPRRTDYGRGR